MWLPENAVKSGDVTDITSKMVDYRSYLNDDLSIGYKELYVYGKKKWAYVKIHSNPSKNLVRLSARFIRPLSNEVLDVVYSCPDIRMEPRSGNLLNLIFEKEVEFQEYGELFGVSIEYLENFVDGCKSVIRGI